VGKHLSDPQQRSFFEQGIVYPVRVLSAEQAASYGEQCNCLEAALGGKPRTVEVRQMHLHFPWAYELATLPRVLDAVEDLLGPDVLIWASELFAKHPSDGNISIGWHRDGPYMGLDPERTLTAWIALSASHLENGCMRYSREADRKRNLERLIRDSHPISQRKARNVPEGETVPVVLQAGEMSLHDAYLLHGSDPNRADDKRVGFAIRFTTPHTRPLADRPPAILVRGEDRFHHFDLRQPPTGDAEDALTHMRQSARRHLDATLKNLRLAMH
jgi:non-haem Fe2+, alpha-ketoglutarate-dependent halogenase